MLIPYSSNSSGNTYIIDSEARTCTCMDFAMRGHQRPCKHIRDLEDRGVLQVLQSIKAVDLPVVEPSTVLCLVCSQPLKTIIDLPNKIHGRCLINYKRPKNKNAQLQESIRAWRLRHASN